MYLQSQVLDSKYTNNYDKHIKKALKMTPKTVRTRLVIISDTHTVSPLPSTDPTHAYRLPLPKADILLHAGDITNVGHLSEYQPMLDMLKAAPAELKLVIPGNHDITMHQEFYVKGTGKNKHVGWHDGEMEDVEKIREMWTGQEARNSGIVYLEEGISIFELKSGARFTVSGRWRAIFTMQIHRSTPLITPRYIVPHGSRSFTTGPLPILAK